MANIFYGLELMANDDIIKQIAILKAINNNINKNGINKAYNIFNKTVRYFESLFSDKEDNMNNIFIQINTEQDRLNKLNMTKNDLSVEFKDVLKELIRDSSVYISDDKICLEVINKVSKYLNIPIDEMPLCKANQIYHKYYNYIEKKFDSSILVNDNYFHKYKFLKNTDNLSKCYFLERRLFQYDKRASNEDIINYALGFIIYLLCSFCIEKIIPKTSYFNDLYDVEKEDAFDDLLKKRKSSNILKMSNNQKIISIQKEIRGLKIKLERDNKRKDDCIKRIEKLKYSKIDIDNKISSQKKDLAEKKKQAVEKLKNVNDLDQQRKMEINSDIYKVTRNIESLNNQLKSVNYQGSYEAKFLEHTMKEIDNDNFKITDARKNLSEIQDLLKKSIEDKETQDAKFKAAYNSRINDIQKRWNSYFKGFSFDQKIYNNIGLFTANELHKVEMALIEIKEIDDIDILSSGKVDDFYNYFTINSINREVIKIVYDTIANKKIHFIDISKTTLFI